MSTRARYAVAFTASLGLVMAILDATIVNVALVPMANAFKTDLSTIQWVITAYFLAQAGVIPISGYFSNRFGIKRVFIICLAIFTLGSLLCGLAQTEGMLIAFRVLQGIGGGALFPIAQAIAFGAFPPKDRAAASAIVAIPVLLAPTFGPTLGGWLTDQFGWPSIFLVNLPVGALTVLMALLILPADKAPERRAQAGFDYPGLILSTLGVLAVVYAFTIVSQTQPGTVTLTNPLGQVYGWGYWLVWALLGVGALLLVAFAFYELRVSKDPVLDLRLFREYNYTISSLVSWVIAGVVFGSLFLLPVFLQQVRIPNLSATDAGLTLIPQGIASAIAVAIGGRLYNRVGVRALVVVGAALLAISSWMLSQLTPTTSGWDMIPALITRGLGFGLTMIPVQTLALEVISGPALAKASSLFNVTRQIFSSVGIAATITLFVQQAASHGAQLAEQARRNLPPGVTFDPNSPAAQAAIEQIRSQAGTAAINDVFFLVMIGTILLGFVGLALPGRAAQAERHAAAIEAGHPQTMPAE